MNYINQKAKVKALALTGILLQKPKLVSEKVTYLYMQNTEDGKKLQWVVFNANFDKADLRKLQFAQPEAVIKVFGTNNTNAKTGQEQIVIQKLLSVSDAQDANTFTPKDIESDFAPITNADTYAKLFALMQEVPKPQAIYMLARCIASLTGEAHA